MKKLIHSCPGPYEAPETVLIHVEMEQTILSGDEKDSGIDDIGEDPFNW